VSTTYPRRMKKRRRSTYSIFRAGYPYRWCNIATLNRVNFVTWVTERVGYPSLTTITVLTTLLAEGLLVVMLAISSKGQPSIQISRLINHSLLPISYLPWKKVGEDLEERSPLPCRALRQSEGELHLGVVSQLPARSLDESLLIELDLSENIPDPRGCCAGHPGACACSAGVIVCCDGAATNCNC
jgi:hypothetical protein